MKKLISAFFMICLFVSTGVAQDGKKLMKNASKLIGKYITKPADNPNAFSEAQDLMMQAFEDKEYASSASAYISKGDIYNKIADNEIKAKLLNPEAEFTDINVATIAYEAYSKALELSTKKGDTKDALNGLIASENNLNNYASELYRVKDYANAFKNFQGSIGAYETLLANEKESRLADPKAVTDQKFFTAVCGYLAKMNAEVKPLFEELHANGSEEALVYEALYNINKDDDPDKAIGYLEEGRTKFPDDSQMLFSEINHYLTAGKLDILIEKLKLAMEKEPENVSVINTLGSVYDQLSVSAAESGDTAKRDEYFGEAMKYYEMVLAKEPQNFDAIYSKGALYYNKAANMTTSINEMSNDFSPAGTKKYNALKEEMDGYFKQALPIFLEAETLNGKDQNTIVALREIYARQNNFEKVDEYKAKLEALGAASPE